MLTSERSTTKTTGLKDSAAFKKLALWFCGMLLLVCAFLLGRSTAPTIEASMSAPTPATATAHFPSGDDLPTKEEKLKAELRRKCSQLGNEAAYDKTLETLLRWAALNPAEALAWTRQNFDPLHREVFVSAILTAWVKTNADAAWTWVTTHLPENPTQLDAVLSETGKTDPHRAWKYATDWLQDGSKKDQAQTIYVSALRGLMYTGNYPEALQLVNTAKLAYGQEEFDLTSLVASEWAFYEPGKAVAWLANTPDDGSFKRQQAMVSLGLSWAQSDPRAAADLAAQLPAGVTRQNMLAVALDAWATAKPNEAGEWLIQHKQHPDFDQVVFAVATSQRTMKQDVHTAIAWADTMLDDDLRRSALNRIVTNWMGRDPAAAEQFLSTTNELSPESIKSIRENMPRPAPPVFGD
jgi:uncharacterized protein (DUF2267 family)